MALHVAYRFRRDIKAVFALSTFLHNDSIVYEVGFIMLNSCIIHI